MEHCVKISENNNSMDMTDELCESKSGILCQFVKSSPCHKKSVEGRGTDIFLNFYYSQHLANAGEFS